MADAFAWLPNWRLQMARRAAEFKAELANLVQARADVREALYSRLTRFQGRAGELAGWRELDTLIQRQHWRLAYFRVAADDINYRRFFNINDLAGLRIELPEVFDHAHQRVLRLVREGVIDGLRIDHIDGLLDPKAYLQRLQDRIAALRGAGRHFYLVVEKILAAHETLREDWPIDGTTGYEFLNQVTALLVDSASERAFSDCYTQFTGQRQQFGEIGRLCKLHIMDNEMSGELNVLARDIARLARQHPRTADFTQTLLRRAIKQLIACFPVYRTYIDASAVLDAADERDLGWALSQAPRHETEIDPSVFEFLEQVLTARLIAAAAQRLLARVAAALRHAAAAVQRPGHGQGAGRHRVLSLQPLHCAQRGWWRSSRFGATMAAFHRATQLRAQRWPHSMLATATHDTKRGEDARARLAALSEFPRNGPPGAALGRILRGPPPSDGVDPNLQPDHNDEYLLYQVLLGSWPAELLDEQRCRGRAVGGICRTRARHHAQVHARGARAHQLGIPESRLRGGHERADRLRR